MSEIVFNALTPIKSGPTPASDLSAQVESLQTTLASLNQQVIILQETIQERDEKIKDLEMRLSECRLASQITSVGPLDHDLNLIEKPLRMDNTLTIISVLINLYKFLFPPGKAV